MSEVLLFRHAGVRCALPAGQVEHVAPEPDGPTVCLWPAPSGPEPGDRAVRVDTAAGSRWIVCSDPRFAELGEDRMMAVTPALSSILNLPHVVGAADLEEGWLWLVDLSRFEESVDEPRSES